MLLSAAVAVGADDDRIKARGEAWQERLGRERFKFDESEASMVASLSRFRANCQIHMIYDPEQWTDITFKFVRDGREVLTIERGHVSSVFFAERDVLYFAHFSPASSGCIVTAYDLVTGKERWRTKLRAIPKGVHSKYSNSVTLTSPGQTEIEADGEGVVFVAGHEDFGDYYEVLDRDTGRFLAHRAFPRP
jgi:hypothetical protein